MTTAFYALYNGELSALEVKRAQNDLDLEFYNGGKKLPRQDLIVFSALNPEPGSILGTSLLRGLPFISDVLMTVLSHDRRKTGNTRGICGTP